MRWNIISFLVLFFLIGSSNWAFSKTEKKHSSHKTYSASRIFKSENEFPRGCEIVGHEFKDNLLVLKPVVQQDTQALYLIHNTSKKSLQLLLKKLPTQIFSPTYENIIQGDEWAAFAMDQPELHFICNQITGSKASGSINCATALKICQYPHVKFADNNMGTYWVVTSDEMKNTVHTAIEKGILLRW